MISEKILKKIKEHMEQEPCETIYTDYKDLEYAKTLAAKSETMDDFYDGLYDSYREAIYEMYLEKTKEIAKIFNIAKEDEDELFDIIMEHYYVEPDYQAFLDQKIRVNIMLNCYNDKNLDYGGDGWYRWLMNSQGYKKSDFPELTKCVQYGYNGEAWNSSFMEGETNDEFIESLKGEIRNFYYDYTRTLTFLTKMTVRDYFKIKEHNFRSILLPRDIEFGLYNPWSGAGSLLDIHLNKCIKLTDRVVNVNYLQIEGVDKKYNNGYTVDEVYGLVSSCWKPIIVIQK